MERIAGEHQAVDFLYLKTPENISSWNQHSWTHKLQPAWKLEIKGEIIHKCLFGLRCIDK